MFEAAKAEKQDDQSELVPFWCFGKDQSVKIERLVPMYPMSKDEVNYERLIKILSLYRGFCGGAKRRAPVGTFANGMPRKTEYPSF